MLTASRSLRLNAQSAPPMPRIEALKDFYSWGWNPLAGDLTMICGRSGNQKSGFALWLAMQWGVPTLYLSGDMTDFEASVRVACSRLGKTTEEVVAEMSGDGESAILKALDSVDITFAFDSPIAFEGIEQNLNAYVEVHNAWPKLLVIDNLMDMEGGESEYAAQQALLVDLTSLTRDIKCSTLVLHHATDATYDAKNAPYKPPSRFDITNKLSAKPQNIIAVALNNIDNSYHITCTKQRKGRQDPTANSAVAIQAYPVMTRFGPMS